MAEYRILARITYSSSTNRNTAQANVNNVVANYPTVYEEASETLPAGVATSGTTVLTIALRSPDEATAEAIRVDLIAAWSSAGRSSSFIGVFKV